MNEHDQRKQHEQELEENDLLAFLSNFRAFWDKHGTTILLMILIVVAILVGVPWLQGRAERQREAAGLALVEAATVQSNRPRALANVAEEHADQPGVAAYALLRAGDAQLYEALGLLEEASAPDATKPMLSEQTLEQLNAAAEYYQRAVAAAPGGENALLALNAKLGLADVHTSRGELDEARKIYQQVQQAADDHWPALAAQATARMGRLEEYNTAITFPAQPQQPQQAADQFDLTDDAALQQLVEQAERRMTEEAEAQDDDQAEEGEASETDGESEPQSTAPDTTDDPSAADPAPATAPQPE